MPETTQRVLPMLAYDDAPAAIEFLCKAFGFDVSFRLDGKDGQIGHAELDLDGARVSLATTWKYGGLASPLDLPAVHTQLYVQVDDVDAHFERAHAAGATIARPPADEDYGARTYRAIDPEGHRWIFGMPLGDPNATS